MQQASMSPRLRVRIARKIDMFPIGILDTGMLGTVVSFDGDGITAPFCLVKLDQVVPALEPWDNHIQVWSDTVPIVTAEDFEMVVVEE